MATLNFTPIIPAGELILVTGATSYIAGQVVVHLLELGYRVRGTSRNPDSLQPLKEKFEQKYGAGKFEAVKVVNFAEKGALEEPLKGVSGVVHIAVDSDIIGGEPEPYITNALANINDLLRLAKASPQIKRIVYTSSSMGAAGWKVDAEYSIGPDTYNEAWIKKAYEPPFGMENAFPVYGASKALSEKSIAKFVKEEKPHFAVNSVLPACNFGYSVSGPFQSTGGWAKLAADGDYSFIGLIQPQIYVDVDDDARIHVGALLHPEVENERLLAYAEPYNWNEVVDTLKKIYPQKTFNDGLPNLGHDLDKFANERAQFVLQSTGAKGWKSMEQSLKEAFDTIYA